MNRGRVLHSGIRAGKLTIRIGSVEIRRVRLDELALMMNISLQREMHQPKDWVGDRCPCRMRHIRNYVQRREQKSIKRKNNTKWCKGNRKLMKKPVGCYFQVHFPVLSSNMATWKLLFLYPQGDRYDKRNQKMIRIVIIRS